MTVEALLYVFAVINNSFLIVQRPTWNISAAYMCTEFSDTGNVKSNCTWPDEWSAMKLYHVNVLNTSITSTFKGNLKNVERSILFYKIRFVNIDRTYIDSKWNWLISNLDNYKSTYLHILNHQSNSVIIILLISVLLFEVTFVCAHYINFYIGTKTSQNMF